MDAAACLGLVPAMAAGLPLEIEGGVCGELLENLRALEEALAMWYGHLKPVELRASNVRPAGNGPPNTRGRGMMFSCGVDSFDTLLRHESEVGLLLHVSGLDAHPADEGLETALAENASAAARSLKKEVVIMRTNLMHLRPLYGQWGQMHASAVAAAGHLASDRVERVYIASSTTYLDLSRWSSHPVTDPMWSSARVRFINEGSHLHRVQKCRLISQRSECLEHLRVCGQAGRDAKNCGRCEKCLRTQVSLRIAGALARCPTFEHVASLREIAGVSLKVNVHLGYWEELLAEAEQSGADGALTRALRKAVRWHRLKRALAWLRKPGKKNGRGTGARAINWPDRA